MNILEQIAQARQQDIERDGHTQGLELPAKRALPVVSFDRLPFTIAEIKKASPSKGDINSTMDPVEQAGRYYKAGIKSVSVLTEQNRFKGSLQDLMDVKAAYPDLAVLRKDFLLSVKDVDISYQAGADAILLIAALLEMPVLEAMYKRANELGMQALVEAHDLEDLEKARKLKADLTGINCRNLKTFELDALIPLQVAAHIDWPCKKVYESGIFTYRDSYLAGSAGFDAVLVGEALVRNPERTSEIIQGRLDGFDAGNSFWAKLEDRRKALVPGRPLVKICGICREDDGRKAAELGADVLGFVFAESPRRADAKVIQSLSDLNVLKVGVVVCKSADDFPEDLKDLLALGLIDAIQFHGSESDELCFELSHQYYKAMRIKSTDDVAAMENYRSPRILVDAFDASAMGGTGKQISPELVTAVREKNALWLAGGLGVENIAEIIKTYKPELIDCSSKLESEPGKKDHAKMTRYMEEVENVLQ